MNSLSSRLSQSPTKKRRSTQAVYLFSGLRIHVHGSTASRSVEVQQINSSTASDTLYSTTGVDEKYGPSTAMTWSHHLCRVSVPHRICTIKTSSIARNTCTVTSCTRHNSSTFCPSTLHFHPSNFSTDTWPDLTAIRNMNGTTSDKDTAWQALSPFSGLLVRNTMNTPIHHQRLSTATLAAGDLRYLSTLLDLSRTPQPKNSKQCFPAVFFMPSWQPTVGNFHSSREPEERSGGCHGKSV